MTAERHIEIVPHIALDEETRRNLAKGAFSRGELRSVPSDPTDIAHVPSPDRHDSGSSSSELKKITNEAPSYSKKDLADFAHSIGEKEGVAVRAHLDLKREFMYDVSKDTPFVKALERKGVTTLRFDSNSEPSFSMETLWKVLQELVPEFIPIATVKKDELTEDQKKVLNKELKKHFKFVRASAFTLICKYCVSALQEKDQSSPDQ